jgi:hypothetical protein
MEIIHPQFSVLTPPDGGKAHSPRQGRHDRSLGITSIRFTRPGWCASECFRANMTRNVSRGPLRGPVIFCRFFPGLRSFVADAGLSAQTPPGLQFKKMRTLLRTLPLAVGCNPFRISPPQTDIPSSATIPSPPARSPTHSVAGGSVSIRGLFPFLPGRVLDRSANLRICPAVGDSRPLSGYGDPRSRVFRDSETERIDFPRFGKRVKCIQNRPSQPLPVDTRRSGVDFLSSVWHGMKHGL